MNVVYNSDHKESEISNEIIANNLAENFYLLEDLLNKPNIEQEKENIINITKDIISFGDKITDGGLKHDFNNAVMFIGNLQMIVEGIIEGDYKKYFSYAKNSVEDILKMKSSYTINDIMEILIDLSFVNDINIKMNIEDIIEPHKGARTINIDNGIIKSASSTLFIGDKLKNVFPEINFEFRRLLQNLIKNSKESGATEISINFGVLLFSKRVIVKYIDNGLGMTQDIIVNTLFIKGESTKLDSGTNTGEGMHGLAKLFDKNNVDIDIYSFSKEGYTSKGFINHCFSKIANGEEDISGCVANTDNIEYYGNFPYETGTEFVFKFN